MKNKNRKRLRAGSLAAAKEISGDAALWAVLSEPGGVFAWKAGRRHWRVFSPDNTSSWLNAAVRSSLTCSRVLTSVALTRNWILFASPEYYQKKHALSAGAGAIQKVSRVIISTKPPCCSLWQVCNPPPRYSFVPAVSLPEIWSGLKLNKLLALYFMGN